MLIECGSVYRVRDAVVKLGDGTGVGFRGMKQPGASSDQKRNLMRRAPNSALGIASRIGSNKLSVGPVVTRLSAPALVSKTHWICEMCSQLRASPVLFDPGLNDSSPQRAKEMRNPGKHETSVSPAAAIPSLNSLNLSTPSAQEAGFSRLLGFPIFKCHPISRSSVYCSPF